MANNQKKSVLKPRTLTRKKEGNFKPSVTATAPAPEVEAKENQPVKTTSVSGNAKELENEVVERTSKEDKGSVIATETTAATTKTKSKPAASTASSMQKKAAKVELTAEEKKEKRYKYQEKQIKISNDIKKKINVVKDLNDYSNDYEVIELLLDLYYQHGLEEEDRFLFDRIDRKSK